MEIRLADQRVVNSPLVGVVGVWDPPLQQHRLLFQDLSLRVCDRSLASLVITLDPSPASYVLGEGGWVTHTDLEWRLEVQRQCGIDCIAIVYLDPAEADKGAQYFLERVRHTLPLTELWLGARQTLGRFRPGSRMAIEASCASLGISVRVLEDIPLGQKGNLQRLLAVGQVAEACRVAGVPPIWRRPQGAELRLPWPPGNYTAIPYSSTMKNGKANSLEQATPVRFHVELRRDAKWCWLTWPDPGVEWIAFLQGPGDRPDSLTRM